LKADSRFREAAEALEQAVVALREAIRLKPYDADAHNNLGVALNAQRKLDEAIAAWREAIRLKPHDAQAHNNLGVSLNGQGKLDEAVAEIREAIRLKSDYAVAHDNLGRPLLKQGKLDEAIAAFREAIRLKPDFAEGHNNLGQVLRKQGDYAGSLAMYRRGHELGIKQPGWHYPSARWVAEAEKLAALAERLPALLKRDERPNNNAERLALAQMCYDTKRHAAAARFWAEAFEADPASAIDLKTSNRYDAACAASLAGTGQGQDDPAPDEAARTGFRAQARDWLRADLGLRSKQIESGDAKDRAAVVMALQHWKADTDLVGIRDADALAKLPENERQDWQAFWAEVDALLARADDGKPK
jgi:Flp pilus assembly protein TadD